MEREATDSEIIEMENIVKDAMNKGAMGFSHLLLKDIMVIKAGLCHLDLLLMRKFQD